MKNILKKLFRDIPSGILMVVGYSMIFFIALNGIVLLENVIAQQPDTIIGNYKYKQSIMISRKSTKDLMDASNSIFDSKENAKDIVKRLQVQSGNVILKTNGVVSDTGAATKVDVMITYNETCNRELEYGEYPLPEDSSNNMAIVGSYHKKYIIERNDKKYININDKEYLVKGIFKDTSTGGYDDTVIVFNNNLRESDLDEIITTLNANLIEVIVCGSDKECDNLVRNIKTKVEENEFYKTIDTPLNTYDAINISISIIKNTITILILVFCIINSIVITSLWMSKKEVSIAICKANGFSNWQVIKRIAGQLISIMGIAVIISIIIQLIYGLLKHNVWSLKELPVLFVGILAIITIMIIITIGIYMRKIVHIAPAQIIKDE